MEQTAKAPAPVIRLLIVDDHPMVREGLKAMLGQFDRFSIIAEGVDGESAIELFRTCKPDVTILDLRLPAINGIAAIRAIRHIDQGARVIALTSFGLDSEVESALEAGACGFLIKGADALEVVAAIDEVHAGRMVFPASVMARLGEGPPTVSLSNREIEVLKLLAEGLRNQEIADRLFITVSTVKKHIYMIMDKLGAKDRTEATRMAIKRGIVSFP